jgi:hypothetical protein
MKTFLLKVLQISAIGILVSSCSEDDNDVPYTYQVSYNLSSTQGEWQSGFADYPVGGEGDWELTAIENSDFNLTSGEIGTGYFLHSNNHSDDTQMYISRKISGLVANSHYNVSIDLQMATNVNDQCMGIGGAPHAVSVKAGLTRYQPDVNVDELDHYRLNIDTGSQTNGGLDAQVFGHIGLESLDDCDPGNSLYGVKNFDNDNNHFEVTSDENGELWLTLLTDSGFEGVSSIYFTQVDLTFDPSAKQAEGFAVALDISEPQLNVESLFYDYPLGREDEWQLTAQPQVIVDLEQGGTTTGYLLHSYNRSDDTGMLLHMPIKGLAVNARYQADFNVTIASNVNDLCYGIGGAPHAVTVKAGLSVNKPQSSIVDGDDHYRLNIDLGNNAQEGGNGINLGDIGSDSLLDCDPSSALFALKEFDSTEFEQVFVIETDESGVLYFSLATDSGFEGPTTMLFTQASVTFTQVSF